MIKFKQSVFIFLICSLSSHAQLDSLQIGWIYKGDTIIQYELEGVVVIAPYLFENKRQERKYNRLKEDIIKAYPLAKIVKKELQHVKDTLPYIAGEATKRKYMKTYEKVIYEKYIDSLKLLNFRQGKLFIKLIYRETGETGYNLIQAYRGNFPAFFWQTMARLVGANLKSEYDLEADAMIEDLILRLEAGQL